MIGLAHLWTLDLEKAWTKGRYRLRLSAPWSAPDALRFVLWLDVWTPSDDTPAPPQVIYDVPLDRDTLDAQAQDGIIEGGHDSWQDERGKRSDWVSSWSLSVTR
jgi:hypothetical protein